MFLPLETCFLMVGKKFALVLLKQNKFGCKQIIFSFPVTNRCVNKFIH
jgi:hypothetical protein